MISFIVPTIGRAHLQQTLDSITCWPGDEILIVGCPQNIEVREKPVQILSCPLGGDWGNTERNYAMSVARGQYLAFMDDDDEYAPGARLLMEDAIRSTPGQLVIFRMRYPNGCILWDRPELKAGNVGTPMLLIPNEPTRLGRWPSGVYEGDWGFLQGCELAHEPIVWRHEVIALIGRNAGQATPA